MDILGDALNVYQDFGYLGILIVSFIGSILVFIPVPYFPVLITAAFNKQLDPHLISLSTAAGAVIAKLIIFYASYYGRNILSTKTKKRILPLQRVLSKYGGLGAFLAALTPIPDDVVYIPLGLAKYSPWKFALSTFLGKFLLSEIIVLGTINLGRPFAELINSEASGSSSTQIAIIVGSIAILVLVIIFYLKIDWSKLIGRWFPWAVDDNQTDNR
ncbi:MAG: DedA family protein [Nitrososphaeraceae archaeon]|nr:DedA family protein [Nitrososphaeraceae archaeon]